MQRVRVHPVLREPKGKQTWLITPGGELLQRRDLLTGSRRLGLSGRQRRAGEDARAARWLEAEGMRGGGWGCRGRSARATQVSVVKLPEELLVLHRQPLVHLWLLLERLLQHGLFCWQLSVTQRAQQVSPKNTCSPRCSTDLRKTRFIRPARGKQRSSALTKTRLHPAVSLKRLILWITSLYSTQTGAPTNISAAVWDKDCEMKTCGAFIVLLVCVNPSLTTCDYVCVILSDWIHRRDGTLRSGKNVCSSNFMNEMEAAGKWLRGALQTLVSITTHTFIWWLLPRECSVPVHAGFEVLILLLDLRKTLIQLDIFVFLEWNETKRNQDSRGQVVSICASSYQLFQFHQLLLLLVELLVFEIQNHFEAVQLLFQVQCVGVSLLGKAMRVRRSRILIILTVGILQRNPPGSGCSFLSALVVDTFSGLMSKKSTWLFSADFLLFSSAFNFSSRAWFCTFSSSICLCRDRKSHSFALHSSECLVKLNLQIKQLQFLSYLCPDPAAGVCRICWALKKLKTWMQKYF